MKSGVERGMLETLPMEQLRGFLPSENIKNRPQDHESFIKYANQRKLLANLDKRLDYKVLQAERHPNVNELRSYMKIERKINDSARKSKQSKVSDYGPTVHSLREQEDMVVTGEPSSQRSMISSTRDAQDKAEQALQAVAKI